MRLWLRIAFNRLCRALRDAGLLPTCTSTATTPWGVRRCSDAPGHEGDHGHFTTPGQPWTWKRTPEPDRRLIYEDIQGPSPSEEERFLRNWHKENP